MKNVVNLWSKIFDTIEPDITIILEEIVFSKKHGHEICVMHLVGKNIFPKMTTEEILSNPKAMSGLSKQDLITITRLDIEIKHRINNLRVVEFDRNGTVVLENNLCERKRYSEKMISQKPEVLDKLQGKEAYSIGYRVGIKEGLTLSRNKKRLLDKVLSMLKIRSK